MVDLPDAVTQIDFGAVYESVSGFSLANARKATAKDLAVICPIHDDTHPSMHLDLAGKKWYCPVCRIGGGIADLICAVEPPGYHGGASRTARRSAAFDWLRSRSFARIDQLRPMPAPAVRAHAPFRKLHNERCTVYDYVDAHGNLRYQVLRFDGFDEQGRPDKYFRQRRRLPEGAWELRDEAWVFVTCAGSVAATVSAWKDRARTARRRKPSGPWAYALEGEESLLLDLPDVLRAAARGEVIVVVEGEKIARLLRARTGLCVTTYNNGAGGHLNPAWLRQVAGASALWSLADSDKIVERRDPATGVVETTCPGRDAALERAHFFRRTVFDVRAIDLFPERFDGSDAEQWLDLRPHATPHELRAELTALAAASPAIG
jgi:hypothetical protein